MEHATVTARRFMLMRRIYQLAYRHATMILCLSTIAAAAQADTAPELTVRQSGWQAARAFETGSLPHAACERDLEQYLICAGTVQQL